MIVVADSGPLHYLILLDHADLLHRFYDEVLVPEAVAAELSTLSAPLVVRDWMSRAPSWLRVVTVESSTIQAVTDDLDLGERAAIALAGAMHADLLLIDEAAGRAEAERRSLRVTGTLGVLRAAAERGLVNVPEMVARLKATNFYADEALLKSAFGHVPTAPALELARLYANRWEHELYRGVRGRLKRLLWKVDGDFPRCCTSVSAWRQFQRSGRRCRRRDSWTGRTSPRSLRSWTKPRACFVSSSMIGVWPIRTPRCSRPRRVAP